MADLTFSQSAEPVAIFDDQSGNELVIDSSGRITTNIQASGTALTATGASLNVNVTNTTLAVTQSGTWTVTANVGTTNGLALDATLAKLTITQGTALGTNTGAMVMGSVTTASPTYTTGQISPLSLDTTGALRVNVTAGGTSGTVAQGSTTSGQSGNLIQGAVTTAAPTYTTAQTNPLSLDTSGRLRIDNSSWLGSTAPTVGSKTSANSIPVVIASDQGAVTISGTVTANIGTTNGLALDATLAKLTITQGTALGTNTVALMGGSVTTAAPTYTTGQISPLNLTTGGAVRVDNSSWIGSTAPTVGSKTSANSIPVVIASDQAAIATSTSADITATGTINALNGTVVATTHGTGSTVFQLTGTFVGTFVAEGSIDNTNWANLTIFPAVGQSTTAGVTTTGSYRVPSTGAYAQMRVRCSAFTSGTATVNMNLSTPVAAPQIFSPNAQNCLVGASHVDGFKASYSASITNLVLATTPTDIFTITGSATKTIRVTRIYLTGTQTTGNTSDILVIRRSTANTGGTSTTQTAVQHDTNDAASTATVRAYTANPTALGTTVGTLASYSMFIPAPQPANGNSPFITPDLFVANRPAEAIVLRGTTQVMAINFNSVTVTGSSINMFVEWTEE